MSPRRAFEVFAVAISIPLFAIGIYRITTSWEKEAQGETAAVSSPPATAPTEAAASANDDRPIQHLRASGLAEDLPFSTAVVAGDMIYLSGTLGLESATGKPPEDAGAEAKLAMESFEASVKLAGASMDDLVNVRVFCSDPDLYAAFNEVYRTYFEGGKFPARAFIITSPLLFDARFEVAGIAYKPR